MRTENRSGLGLDIFELDGGRERLAVTNWEPGLTAYTDTECKRLTKIYRPGIIYNGTYQGFIPSEDLTHEIIGRAFGANLRDLEEVVHPLLSISTSFSEFIGFAESEWPKLVEICNSRLPARLNFSTRYNHELLERSVREDYLRVDAIGEERVLFPTEKSVRAMCNTRGEEVVYALALHTGCNMGIGHRYVPPEYGD